MALSRIRIFGLLRQTFVTLTVAGCAIMVLWLGPQVFTGLEDLRTASGRNLQYNISRLEVELAELQASIAEAEAGRGAVEDVRTRFDIFYGRLATVAVRMNMDRDILFDFRVRASLAELQDYVDRSVSFIDADDAELRASLPILRVASAEATQSARLLSGSLVSVYARLSEEDRARFSRLVSLSGMTAGTTMAAVAVAIALLNMQVRVSRDRATEAERARSRLEATIEASLDAIVVSDRLGCMVAQNAAAEALFGWSAAELKRCRLTDLIAAGQLPEGFIGRMELTARRRDGTTFPAELSIMFSDTGGSARNIVFIRNIQARKHQEAALISARDAAREAEQARARFFAVMSHEMRTPLNGMIGMLDLLRLDGAKDDKQAERMAIAANAAEILLRHVNDALDIARIEAGHIQISEEAFELRDIIESVLALIDPLAQKTNTRISLYFSSDIPPQHSDPYRVRQVLNNLIGNAIKHTSGGNIHVSAFRSDHMLTINVDDNGGGVTEDQRERIFEEFVMLNDGLDGNSDGTGLGLAISRRIARALGGDIQCLEGPGGIGSRFQVTLPHRPVGYIELPQALPDCSAQHILVVEDNETNRIVLGEMLTGLGHQVEYAFDGVEGVAAATATGFDLILTDISMPRLDGVAATRQIRAGGGPSANVPIIGVTAHAQAEEHAKFRAAGMNDCLTKPLRREQVTALVATYCAESVPQQPTKEDETMGADVYKGAIDHQALSNLMEGLGERTFQKVLSMFLSEGTALVADLDAGADRQKVHRLAGTAGLFGVPTFLDGLQRLELAIRADDSDAIELETAGVAGQWPIIAASLEEFHAEAVD